MVQAVFDLGAASRPARLERSGAKARAIRGVHELQPIARASRQLFRRNARELRQRFRPCAERAVVAGHHVRELCHDLRMAQTCLALAQRLAEANELGNVARDAIGAPRLAQHPLHFRKLLQDGVGRLQDPLRLARRYAWHRRRHVEQHAFVQWGDKLGAQSAVNRDSEGSRDQDHGRHEALVTQRVQQRRLINADQQVA